MKLPYKAKEEEIEYIRKVKKAFRSVHIFISSDEEDAAIIRKRFKEWRKQLHQSKEMEEMKEEKYHLYLEGNGRTDLPNLFPE